MLRSISLVLLTACGFEHGVTSGGSGDGGMPADTPASQPDGEMVTADAQQCWSVPGVTLDVCLDAPMSGAITIGSNTTIATTTSGSTDLECKPLVTGSSDVCVIAAATIAIVSSATLSASGDRPLVLLANAIIVDGTIDIASHHLGQVGPNADAAGCNNGSNASNAGGGQGGSFGGKGGDGGDQDGQNNSGGRAGNALTVTSLRGGGPGGRAGGGNSGGHGGGAVALVAASITFGATGKINASGAGVQGGDAGREGGSGAGSGGMIVLAAPTISVDPNTEIFANGGHGGGGSSDNNAGGTGTDPTTPMSGGGGGLGPDNAGDGGTGFPAMMRNGRNGTGSGDGGGGGGGGAGVIKVFSSSSLAGAKISPLPS
jgi:hypothetical protein